MHYKLNRGEISKNPPATDGECIAYIIQKDGKEVLCIMEGDAYHQFDIGKMGLHRLAAECGDRLWSLAQGAT